MSSSFQVRNQELAAEVDQHAQSNRDLLIQIKELVRSYEKETIKWQSFIIYEKYSRLI